VGDAGDAGEEAVDLLGRDFAVEELNPLVAGRVSELGQAAHGRGRAAPFGPKTANRPRISVSISR
jgi:hypothetical protein